MNRDDLRRINAPTFRGREHARRRVRRAMSPPQPTKDNVAVALAEPAHGPHAVDHGRLDWMIALHGRPYRALVQRRGDGVIGPSVRTTRIISAHSIPAER